MLRSLSFDNIVAARISHSEHGAGSHHGAFRSTTILITNDSGEKFEISLYGEPGVDPFAPAPSATTTTEPEGA